MAIRISITIRIVWKIYEGFVRKDYIIDVIILVHRDQFAIIFNKRGLGALYYSIINRSTVIDDNILYEKSVSIGCLVSEDRAR